MAEEQPITPPDSGAASPAAPAVEYVRPGVAEAYTEWGPPSTGRFVVALLIVVGITAIGTAVVWTLWGSQLWNTFTGDWT